jgi:acetyl/propionyl-CoA carboxylase alpha subunit
MRVVDREDRLIEAAAGARREAASAFGDDTVFIEAYLSQPRHVEIQVFGDTHGHIVSLFERECSIQRRHQKIIEESPSPAVDEGLRQRMGDAARAVDYVGAGTVEFLLSGGEFSFLEMNTRLQVEHPVTEAVTGLDLVRLQILVAEGKALPPEALAPSMSGHAIEARLYAEDPANGFLPVTGTLHQVRFPAHPGLRVDSGVEDGSVISVDYDPMLAKVVAWGRSREEAARRLSAALRRTRLHGSTTNRELLARILTTDEFLAGRTDTAFLDRHDPAMLSAPLVPPVERGRAALAAALAAQAERVAGWKVLTTVPSGFRNNPAHFQTTRFTVGAEEVEVDYRFDGRGRLSGRVDGESQAQVILHQCTPARVGLEVDGHLMWFDIERAGPFHHVDGPSGPVTLLEHPRFPHSAPDEAPGSLQAPMPGRIVRIEVSVGDRVAEGAAIVVLEAMKMEHTLRAPVAGVVAEVKTAVGDQVDADQVLAVVEEG